MPQVRWPGKTHVNRKRQVTMTTLVVLVMGGIIGSALPWATPPAEAAFTNTLPDPALDSHPTALVITQTRVPALIAAPNDYVKLYIHTNAVGTASFNIYNAGFDPCGSQGDDADFMSPGDPCVGRPVSANMTVLYDFFAMDANETPPITQPLPANPGPTTYLFTLNGQTGNISSGGSVAVPRNGWSGNIQIPVNQTVVSSLTGYRVVIMEARWETAQPANIPGTATPEVSRLHSYRVRTASAQDQVGYWEAAPGSPPSDGQYIIHYLNPGVLNVDTNTEFDFAPSCDVNSPQTAYLRWFDVDNSDQGGLDGTHGAWDFPPWFRLVETDPAGNQTFVRVDGNTLIPNLQNAAGVAARGIGANNVYRQLKFTARPGWKYQWQWHNLNGNYGPPGVGTANNIQMWMPYDSINYNISCFNYHSTISASDGKAPGQTLDMANPADRHVAFLVHAHNFGADRGPTAHTNAVSSGTAAETPRDVAVGPDDVNQVIQGNSNILNDGNYKFAYNIDPAVVYDGEVLCFSDTIQPQTNPNDPPGPSDNQICYTIHDSKRYPSVQSFNSDVHAGGGSCQNGVLKQGTISTHNLASSQNAYVVSASAVAPSINNFKSNNGNTNLNLGQFGGYATICRDDLLLAAKASRTGATISAVADVTNFNLSTWTDPTNPNSSSVYFYDGAADTNGNQILHLSGTVKQKTTIVATAGKIEIDGNITTANPAIPPAVNNLISLGIISAGGIDISKNALLVDAYLFADGNIDTCFEGGPAPGNAVCNTATLVINGFIMGNTLSLHRLGPLNSTGSPVGEKVVMTPQVYLNPPTYFDDAANNSLNGVGEGRPLF